MGYYEDLGKTVIDVIGKYYSYLSLKSKEFEILKRGLPGALSKVSNDDAALEILNKSLATLHDPHIYILHEKTLHKHSQFNINPPKAPNTLNTPIRPPTLNEKETKLAKILQEADTAADLNHDRAAAKKYEECAKIARELGQKAQAKQFLKRARKFRAVKAVPNFDADVADSYVENPKVLGPITVGAIGDSCYIRIDSAREQYRDNFEALVSLPLPYEKFIIDLRGNGGGNSSVADTLVAFLLGNREEQVAFYTRKRKDESYPSLLTDFEPHFIKSTLKHATKKVALLFGPLTVSSGEIIALEVKAIPGCISIGDVTRGLSGNPFFYLLDGPSAGKMSDYRSKPLDNGAKFAIALPSWLCYRTDKVLVQDNGIVPDIRIPTKKSIIHGTDRVLETVINRI